MTLARPGPALAVSCLLNRSAPGAGSYFPLSLSAPITSPATSSTRPIIRRQFMREDLTEEWKNGRMETWKVGELRPHTSILPFGHYSTVPLFHPSIPSHVFTHTSVLVSSTSASRC